jgi:hypothetical protein
MLAKGRATVAVSRAEGARGIKTEDLEGVERVYLDATTNTVKLDKDGGGPGRD